MIATYGIDKDRRQIFSKDLWVDEAYFLNLINLAERKSYRNLTQLDIAKELMSQFPLA